MLLWLDMEMTGLDVGKEVPIEVATIVTDWQFRPVHHYHTVIRQPREYLDRMDDWNREHHKSSGLTDQVPNGKEPANVEKDLCEIARSHFSGERPILAGNSIGQDRLFIDKYFPQFASMLHYRMLDVSSWKIVFNSVYGLKFTKKQTHRAVEDIQESIAELQFYLKHVKKDSQ